MSAQLIKNGRLVMETRVIDGGAVLIEDGKIARIYDKTPNLSGERLNVIDAGGLYVSPGFIDVHVHGGGGYDFLCGDEDNVLSACRTHLKHGTTAIMATISTADNPAFLKAMSAMESAAKKTSQLAGVHIEGPYFAMSQRGAQSPRFIRNPDPKEYMEIAERFPMVKRWAVAPELDGALDMARALRPRGIHMSIGHSDALYEQVLPAYEAGFDCVKDLYSGMSTVRRINAFRYSGIVEAAYLLDGLTVELIADGCHLPASLLKLAYKIKGPERIMLITDGISAAGMENVQGEIFSQTCDSMVIIEDGVAKLPDRKAFGGSIATGDRLVRTMMKLAGVDVVNAVKMMTATPAHYMGIDYERGTLAQGKRADIVLFDQDVNVKQVFLGGETVL